MAYSLDHLKQVEDYTWIQRFYQKPLKIKDATLRPLIKRKICGCFEGLLLPGSVNATSFTPEYKRETAVVNLDDPTDPAAH